MLTRRGDPSRRSGIRAGWYRVSAENNSGRPPKITGRAGVVGVASCPRLHAEGEQPAG